MNVTLPSIASAPDTAPDAAREAAWNRALARLLTRTGSAEIVLPTAPARPARLRPLLALRLLRTPPRRPDAAPRLSQLLVSADAQGFVLPAGESVLDSVIGGILAALPQRREVRTLVADQVFGTALWQGRQLPQAIFLEPLPEASRQAGYRTLPLMVVDRPGARVRLAGMPDVGDNLSLPLAAAHRRPAARAAARERVVGAPAEIRRRPPLEPRDRIFRDAALGYFEALLPMPFTASARRTLRVVTTLAAVSHPKLAAGPERPGGRNGHGQPAAFRPRRATLERLCAPGRDDLAAFLFEDGRIDQDRDWAPRQLLRGPGFAEALAAAGPRERALGRAIAAAIGFRPIDAQERLCDLHLGRPWLTDGRALRAMTEAERSAAAAELASLAAALSSALAPTPAPR